MPIATTDLLLKLSNPAAAAGNVQPQANPNASLGKYISTTQLVDNTLNNLFDDITGDENAQAIVDYRCIFIHNNHATLTLMSAVAWILSDVTGGATIAIATDNIAASAIASAAPQAATIANETTAPAGIGVFAMPVTKATGIPLGNIGPGQCRAIWIRRTAANTPPLNNDGMQLRVEGDTLA